MKPTLRSTAGGSARVDASDVIQEASMSALRELPNYLIFVRLKRLKGLIGSSPDGGEGLRP